MSDIKEHTIISEVYTAKESSRAADDLVRKYLPFIKAECARFLGRPLDESLDDEYGIAMFAFHEAAQSYERTRGAFLPFAAKAIKNRLIDYTRRERRHRGVISLDVPVNEEEDSPTLLEQMAAVHDELTERQALEATKGEVALYSSELTAFGLELSDIADNSPKQERTLAACRRAVDYAKENPQLIKELLSTKKLPLGRISEGSGIERKTLERHRKYLVAMLLAYTNGFEIIRGHLRRMIPVNETKGGTP